MNTTKGILLIACGHQHYFRMAAALAAMLKAADSTTKIHLAYAGSAMDYLSEGEKALFDSLAVIPPAYYTWKGQNTWIMTKVYMYELSPFAETLFLDCDIAWLSKSPALVFDELAAFELTYANSGLQTHSQWADIEQVKQAYGIEKVLGIHSEFVYFKKTDAVQQFFKAAQDIYTDLKVEATVFAGAIPDELPFMIAAELTGMMPHRQPYFPVFWYKRDKKMLHSYQIAKDYYAMSMGGKDNHEHEMNTYNILSRAAYFKIGLSAGSYPYQWKFKRSFLAERQNY